MNHELDYVKQEFEKIIEFLSKEFSGLQAGRAHSGLVENITVEAYNQKLPIKGLANIIVPDVKTITIQPWDKSTIGAVEKAIQMSDLGLNPVNEGILLRIVLPELTAERREQLAKVVHDLAEKSKISIRQIRQDKHNKFKIMQKDNDLTEDDLRYLEKHLQELVDEYNQKIDEMAKNKEEGLKTV